jgi:hypothetical protein
MDEHLKTVKPLSLEQTAKLYTLLQPRYNRKGSFGTHSLCYIGVGGSPDNVKLIYGSNPGILRGYVDSNDFQYQYSGYSHNTGTTYYSLWQALFIDCGYAIPDYLSEIDPNH